MWFLINLKLSSSRHSCPAKVTSETRQTCITDDLNVTLARVGVFHPHLKKYVGPPAFTVDPMGSQRRRRGAPFGMSFPA